MTVQIRQFDTLDALVTDKLGTVGIPEGFEMPEFPIPTENVNSIDDILNLIQFLKDHKLDNMCPKYRKLVDSETIIRDFNQMVGMDGPKANIATQILSLCDRIDQPSSLESSDTVKKRPNADTGSKASKASTIQKESEDNEEPLLNTVIYGPPGCGKTTIAVFMAKLYLKFGVLETGKIVKGNRANLIGQWVGETAIKTEKVLKQALGGVLFIDEAYQLGHAVDGNRCPFAYECINSITQFITENKGRITIILAGYKEDIQDNFFAQNEGLDRRFPWKYTLKPNKPEELVQIFELQARKSGYAIARETVDGKEESILKPSFFENHKKLFEYSGGDTQILFDKCKMMHDKRMFSQLRSDKTIAKVDLDKGFEIFKKSKDETTTDAPPPAGMYN
jgi:hypothetical protein